MRALVRCRRRAQDDALEDEDEEEAEHDEEAADDEEVEEAEHPRRLTPDASEPASGVPRGVARDCMRMARVLGGQDWAPVLGGGASTVPACQRVARSDASRRPPAAAVHPHPPCSPDNHRARASVLEAREGPSAGW